ncbi:arsenate reductase ArsC [Thermodesulfovibrionales bacterium]|nr:arsenate reductase ArsC [Thermodesulfovibrionales bacterium]MCL0046818.1 arsenate reductase ArsC [Thermodesulfovibrionales bacterium]MCL0085751.1 arsenate reductase ArsC [Thermodesulfovibrionales bacterium]
MKKILFVCIENSCRSQIAEAFARLYGKDKIEPFSAGSQPSGEINPKAIESMKEIGYDLTKHSSKSLTEIPQQQYEYAITMGCGDVCPFVPTKCHDDWRIPDPKELSMDEFRKIRALIEGKVKELIAKV